jgi:hypothetical protein
VAVAVHKEVRQLPVMAGLAAEVVAQTFMEAERRQLVVLAGVPH